MDRRGAGKETRIAGQAYDRSLHARDSAPPDLQLTIWNVACVCDLTLRYTPAGLWMSPLEASLFASTIFDLVLPAFLRLPASFP